MSSFAAFALLGGTLPAQAQDLTLGKTVYIGHNGGAGCPGQEVARGEASAQVTFCFLIRNNSLGTMTGVTLEDPELGLNLNLGDLPPGAFTNLFFESVLLADQTNFATVAAFNAQSVRQSFTDSARLDLTVACPSTCFIVSDVANNGGPDNLYQFDVITGSTTYLGQIRPDPAVGFDANCLEALTFEPAAPGLLTPRLFSVDAGITCGNGPIGSQIFANQGFLGTIDYLNAPTNGFSRWTPLANPIGVARGFQNGILQLIPINDVDAMDFDTSFGSGKPLYLGVRQDIGPDLLVRVDATTGQLIPDSFGPGIDYITLQVVTNSVGQVLDDIDDFAFSPVNGQLWGIANDDGTFDELVQIDKNTGAILQHFPLLADDGITRFQDMEGLNFDPVRGELYGTSGSSGTPSNSLFRIQLTGANPGRAALVGAVPGTGDYEGSDCFVLTPDTFSTISGVVFWDLSENGLQDGGESRLENALVTLYLDVDGNGFLDINIDVPVDIFITGPDGSYSFIVPVDQRYVVAIERPGLPPGFCGFTTRSEASIFIPNICGVNEIAPDFGVSTCRTLGDSVWDDLNQNGLQDMGEPGIPNVTVNLYNTSGGLLTNQVTDAQGGYLFELLISSNYVVEVVIPAGYFITPANQGADDTVDSDINPATGRTSPVSTQAPPPPGFLVASNLTVDAGLYLTNDVGIQKLAARPLPGSGDLTFDYVLVVTNSGTRTQTQVLVSDILPDGLAYVSDDASGVYNEPTRSWTATILSLDPGASTNLNLRVAVTNGFGAAKSNTACVSIPLPELNPEDNCDTLVLARIGDFVWQDFDGDGVQDPSEMSAGIPGVAVALLDDQGVQIAGTVTDANGRYAFAVPAGTYEVLFIGPGGTNFSPSNNAADDQTDSDADPMSGRTGAFPVIAGQLNDDVDAGIQVPLQLDKSTSLPLAGNGAVTFDYVIDIANLSSITADPVIVTDTLPPWAQYISDDAGGGVVGGIYTASIGPLEAESSRRINIRVRVITASLSSPLVNTASVNQVVTVLQTNAVIGNLVFLDNDRSQTQSAGDSGVPGSYVELTDPNGVALASTNTNASGEYAFIVPPGDYRIRFTRDPGEAFIPPDAGADDALDSDANPADGFSPVLTLLPGQSDDSVDAGVMELIPGVLVQKTVAIGAGQPCPGADLAVILAGQTVTYCFAVTNTGETYLAATTLTDADITPSLAMNLGLLAPGQSVTVAVDRVISSDLVNLGRVDGVPSDPRGVPTGRPTVTSTDTAQVDVIGPSIELRKSVYEGDNGVAGCEGGNFLAVTNGQTVTYCFVVINTGDSLLADVALDDTDITPPVAFSLGTLLAGQSVTVAVSRTATVDLLNTATASGQPPAGPRVVSRDSAEVDVVNPGIGIQKTAYIGRDGGASCPGLETVSGTNNTAVTYCFVIRNTGDAPLSNVVVTDSDVTPPFTANIGALPVGGVVTAFVERTITADLVNTASVTGRPPAGPPVTSRDPATVVFIPVGSIGDTVWYDVNGNGVVDPGERLGPHVVDGQPRNGLGIPGVRVNLYQGTGDTRVLIRTTLTSVRPTNSGYYLFANLLPDLYTVEVDQTTLSPLFTRITTPASYVVDMRNGPGTEAADFGFSTNPTAIELASLQAIPRGGVVDVLWTTGSEVDNLGFNLYRAERPDGARTRINAHLIEAQGAGSGADYRFTDATVAPGGWFYWLEDIDFDGTRTLHGPVQAEVKGLEGREFPAAELEGLHRIAAGAQAAGLDVELDGVVLPATQVADGDLVVHLPAGGKTVKLVRAATPARMAVEAAPPTGGDVVVIVSEDGNQAALVSPEDAGSVLAIGFAGADLVVIDTTDAARPVRLEGVEVLRVSRDNGAYFSPQGAGRRIIVIRQEAIPPMR